MNSSNSSNPTNPSNSSNPSNAVRTTLLKLTIIVACLVLLYFRVAQGLVSDWIHMPDFSHGFLIPLVSFYFVYERRKELSALSPSAAWGGIGLILLGIFFLLLGNLATEFFTMRFSMLVVLGGIILFLLGKEFYKTLLFPLVFLIFMIPIPSVLWTESLFQCSFSLQKWLQDLWI